jgi:hypothetical protein
MMGCGGLLPSCFVDMKYILFGFSKYILHVIDCVAPSCLSWLVDVESILSRSTCQEAGTEWTTPSTVQFLKRIRQEWQRRAQISKCMAMCS